MRLQESGAQHTSAALYFTPLPCRMKDPFTSVQASITDSFDLRQQLNSDLQLLLFTLQEALASAASKGEASNQTPATGRLLTSAAAPSQVSINSQTCALQQCYRVHPQDVCQPECFEILFEPARTRCSLQGNSHWHLLAATGCIFTHGLQMAAAACFKSSLSVLLAKRW